jgi:hypothetical protein
VDKVVKKEREERERIFFLTFGFCCDFLAAAVKKKNLVTHGRIRENRTKNDT